MAPNVCPRPLWRLWVASLLLLQTSQPVQAAIEVIGLTHQSVYPDRVAFIIPAVPGTDTRATLNGLPLTIGATNEVTEVNYHELHIRRKDLSSNTEETRFVQFIVRSSERKDSEWGLPPWTPRPVIQGAPSEFEGTGLRVTLPSAYPAAMEIPVVAWVTNRVGAVVRSHGLLSTDHGSPIQLRRGVGSGFLKPSASAEPTAVHLKIASIATQHAIAMEPNPAWTDVAGILKTNTTWPERARIRVTAPVTLEKGVTLEIGAGAVIQCLPGSEFQIAGVMKAHGVATNPVVFAPSDRSRPWGGLVLRTNSARLELTQTILWGGGAETNWFQLNPGSGSTHKPQRPMIYLQNGATAILTDSAVLDSAGQATHGESSSFHCTRTLIQRHVTGGQHNRGEVVMNDSAVIEFPYEGAPFADDDNDGLYLTGGAHSFTNCLFGWALDDALDAGTGSAGSVTLVGCWFEGCYHEGMAWSDDRVARIRDSVVVNCGQGIEAGFGAPDVVANHILSTGNLIGARFGDNYARLASGFLRITNSLILYNHKDLFARTWAPNAWSNQLDRLAIQGNWLTQNDSIFGPNTTWNPVNDGALLSGFLQEPFSQEVGMGWAHWGNGILPREMAAKGLNVGLSRFTTSPTFAICVGEDGTGKRALVSVELWPGELGRSLALHDFHGLTGLIKLTLTEPFGVVMTGPTTLWVGAPNEPDGLHWTRFQGKTALLWMARGAVLEAAETVTGPWNELRGTVAPYFPEVTTQLYFRLRFDGTAVTPVF